LPARTFLAKRCETLASNSCQGMREDNTARGVAKINHLIQAAAEEISRVAHQTISTKLPENDAFRG